MLIVSAASSNHAGAVLNLITTAKYFAPEARVVIYDLGLSASEADTISSQVELRPLDFSKYPAHVARLKAFAWKPVVIQDAAGSGEPVLWMDAGNLIHGPLDEIWLLLATAGFYEPVHYKPVEYWTQPVTMERLGLGPDDPIRKLRMRHASVIGFSPQRAALLDRFVETALDEATIAPVVPPGQKHHYDMSLLSILAYQAHAQAPFTLRNRWINVTRGNDALNASQVAERIASGWQPKRPLFGAVD